MSMITMNLIKLQILAGVALVALACVGQAQDTAPASSSGIRHALIVCGLAGDMDHRKLFAETIEKLSATLTTNHGFRPENVAVLWGDEPTEKDGPALKSS